MPKKTTCMTIDQVIDALKYAKERSKDRNNGNSCVCLCENDREYTPIVDVGVDIDPDGAVVLVSLHLLSERTTTHFIDPIDAMSDDRVLDECQILTGDAAGGWPTDKCREYLKNNRRKAHISPPRTHENA